MRIESVVVGPFEVNCWIVWNPDREAVVIDPGDDAADILNLIECNRLTIRGYALTHGHIDHVSALAALYERHPAPFAMHADDEAWAFSEDNRMPPHYGIPRRPPAGFAPLADGADWAAGGLIFRVMFTPGHSPGSLCLVCADAKAIFTGDTLFAGSIGRTDLRGSNPRAMRDSLKRLAALGDELTVYPGHGPTTTMGHEKLTNFFLRTPSRA